MAVAIGKARKNVVVIFGQRALILEKKENLKFRLNFFLIQNVILLNEEKSLLIIQV